MANRVGFVFAAAVIVVLADVTLRRNADYSSAVSIWQTVVEARPRNYRARYNLGNALKSQGRLDEAVYHYRQALQIKPDYTKAHNNLGVALACQGKLDEAIGHYRQALQFNPDYIEECNNLAWALVVQQVPSENDVKEAVHLAERAARLTVHRNAAVLDTLAACYAAAGQFERAVAAAQKAIEQASLDHNDELAGYIQGRLELYRQEKPYQELVQPQGEIRH